MDEKIWPANAKFQETDATNCNKLLDGPCSATNLISQLKQEENCDAGSQLQENVEAVICETEKYKIQQILEQVNTLKPIEKLLLYLKLPTESSNNDPLRQPLNPLGSRTEISQTIIWIRTHLEQDQDISLQKKAVYDEYQSFCDSKKIKPLSTADFGKVMKQVYPTVKPRRLGVRGQSQYCYSGLRKRVRLHMPLLSDLSESEVSYESDLTSAAWSIIREWCIINFKKQFHSLPALAYYLIITFSIGNGSTAANTITNAFKYQEDGGIVQNPFVDKHRETTMLLQRKLQEKSEVKEQKRKNQPGRPRSRNSSKCKRAKGTKSQSASPVKSLNLPNADDISPCVSDGVTLPEFSSLRHILNEQADAPNGEKNIIEKLEDGQSDCIPLLNSASCSSAQSVNQRSSASTSNAKGCSRNSTQSSSTIGKHGHRNKYKSIQPKPYPDISLPSEQTNDDTTVAAAQHRKYAKKKQQRLQQVVVQHKREPSLVLEEHEQNMLLSRERLNSISTVRKEDLDDYLMGTSNSQEQSEEEIMSYFENNNEVPTNKLQHLRQCLIDSKINEQQSTNYSSAKPQKRKLHAINPNVNIRRRVSFDTQSGENTSVPPSPNTRRRNFNFTPIGGVTGDVSPTGAQSMCSSTNESPFVSPRNTPVPRARGQSYPHVLHPTVNQHRLLNSNLELQLTLDENKPIMSMATRASAPPSPKGNYNYVNSKTNYGQLNISEQCMLTNANDLTQELNQLLASNSNIDSINLRSKSVPVPYYNNVNIVASENANYTATEDFQADMSNIVSDLEPKLYIDDSTFNDPQSSLQSKLLARSQSIHIDTQMDGSKYSTRSVPSTPVSCPDFKFDLKSYPRTPTVAPESTFNYNHDFLINGQRIKSKNTIYKSLFDNPAEDTSENFLNQLNFGAGTRTDTNLNFDETVDPNNLNY